MSYNSQEEHDYNMNAQAQAEAEYQEQEQYFTFLDTLIESKQYYLHGVYIALDILNESAFKKSGLSAFDYFIKRKDELEKAKENIPCDTDELPF